MTLQKHAPNGRIVDDSTFGLLVDLEIKKAQRLRYPVAVVCLEADESSTGSRKLANMTAWVLRATDCVAWRDSRSVIILLIDAESVNLPVIVDRLTSALNTGWSAGGASYPDSCATPERLIDQAAAMQARAREDGGRRLYVAPLMS